MNQLIPSIPAGASAIEVIGTARTPSPQRALVSLSLAVLLSSLGTSIAHVALPTLAATFSASFSAVQWIVLAYLLAITGLIVSIGRLGDIIGRRRLLLAGILIFIAASVLCGVTSSLGFLIAARAVQGVGAAVMMTLTLALVTETVSKAKTGSALGLLGTMSALGTALGPALGGALISLFGWRSIFLINVPLGLLAVQLAYQHLPLDRSRAKSARVNFDGWGTLLLLITLGTYALAMTLGRGHFGSINLWLLLVAAIGLGLFVLAQYRAASPLIEIAMFRDGRLRVSLAMNTLVATVLMATLVVGPFHLSRALGLAATWVGLGLTAGPVVAALAGVPAGRCVDRWGGRRVVIIGLTGIALGCALLALLPATLGLPGYVVPIVLITSSYALFQAGNTTRIMADVTADRRGVTSGLLNLSRNLGLITGASAMGALFAFASGGELMAATPAAVVRGTQTTFGVASLLIIAALILATRTTSPRPRRPAGS